MRLLNEVVVPFEIKLFKLFIDLIDYLGHVIKNCLLVVKGCTNDALFDLYSPFITTKP